MKIAKKVLAVLMAVAMIAGLSAMAFAAEAGTAKLTVGKPDKDGIVYVKLYFKNCIGLHSWDLKLNYDADVLEFDSMDDGADALDVNLNSKSNKVYGEFNDNVAGEIKYSGYFKEDLWTSEKFASNAKAGKTVNVNGENFHVATFTFVVKDDTPDATKITLKLNYDGKYPNSGTAYAPKGATLQFREPAATETTTKKVDPKPVVTTAADPANDDAKKDDAKKNENKNDNAGKTDGAVIEEGTDFANEGTAKPGPRGDNMALAAAGAVVILAGAAFVISKKRK